MARLCFVFVGLAVAWCGAEAADSIAYRVDSETTRVGFGVRYLGISTARGRFERIAGTIVLDAANKAGRIDLEIEADSVDTGWDLRDNFLRGPRMLDGARHPSPRFRSRELRFEGARLAAVAGELTLRGVTLPVRFDVVHFECPVDPEQIGSPCVAIVAGRISRAAFGMDFAYPLIGDDVDLEFTITAFPAQ